MVSGADSENLSVCLSVRSGSLNGHLRTNIETLARASLKTHLPGSPDIETKRAGQRTAVCMHTVPTPQRPGVQRAGECYKDYPGLGNRSIFYSYRTTHLHIAVTSVHPICAKRFNSHYYSAQPALRRTLVNPHLCQAISHRHYYSGQAALHRDRHYCVKVLRLFAQIGCLLLTSPYIL